MWLHGVCKKDQIVFQKVLYLLLTYHVFNLIRSRNKGKSMYVYNMRCMTKFQVGIYGCVAQ